jgi:hypothetical protein
MSIDVSAVEHAERAAFESKVIRDLKKIQKTAIGADLLRELASEAGGRTTIMPQPGIRGPVTQTERSPEGVSTNVILTPGALDAAAALREAGIKTEKTRWNPSPSDVVLFHELIHAYRQVKGTTAKGVITAAQAIIPADVGERMSEYQAVGLSTRDGDRAHQYAEAHYTENKYRAQTRRPPRTSYQPSRTG